MNARQSARRLLLLVALLGLAAPACSGDDSGGGATADAVSADADSADAGGDATDSADVLDADRGDTVGDAPATDTGGEGDAGGLADTDAGPPRDGSADADGGPEPITLELVEGCNPFTTSDVCLLPYPSSFFQEPDPTSATGFRMSITQESLPVDPGDPTIDVAPINTADGSSPAGPILVHFGVDIDAGQLTGQRELLESLASDHPIALFDAETGRRLMFMSEMDANRSSEFEGRYAMIIRPMEPMEMGHRHVVALTTDLRDVDGEPLTSPPAFAALRDGVPTTNDIIEDVREQYESHFELLASHGYRREELLLAWDFVVASEDYTTGSVRAMREEALEEMGGTGMGYTIDSVEDAPTEHIARRIAGTFEVPTYLNEDNVFEYDEDHHPIRQPDELSFPYTMVIPASFETRDGPGALVVFGHGLFGSGAGSLRGRIGDHLARLANEMGAILIATDWIGLSSGDLELIISEVVPDLNRLALVTDRLQQSIINNLTLTELAIGTLSDDPAIRVGEGPMVDPERVYYAGGSLGGIQGSSFVAMSHRITRGVLSVPGAGWLNMLTRSSNWDLLAPVVNIQYPDPLAQQVGIALIQSLFDLSDPVNLSRHLYARPLDDAPDERLLLLHVAVGDSQVPNLASDMLARSIGARLLEPSIYTVPGLEPITAPTSEPTLMQIYQPDLVEPDPPSDANYPPPSRNGTHGQAPFLDHILNQTFEFLTNGVIVDVCTGACNPD